MVDVQTAPILTAGTTLLSSAHQTMIAPQRPYLDDACPICGDRVSGYHYGLLTCESCKGFFKRTVQNKKVYQCSGDSNCAVEKTCRKRCPYCRFQKCLKVGMKVEAVRKDRMRGGRNKFGTMYKRDRARRMQAFRMGSFNSPIGHHSDHLVSHNTAAGLYTPHSRHAEVSVHRESSKFSVFRPYSEGVQSPTLSSTHSPTNNAGTRGASDASSNHNDQSYTATASYVPNCDNLAALLSTNIDDPLRSMVHSTTPLSSIYESLRLVKAEPFDCEPAFLNVSTHDFAAPFTSMLPTLTPLPTPTSLANTDKGLPPVPGFLPVCTVPTSRSFDFGLPLPPTESPKTSLPPTPTSAIIGNGTKPPEFLEKLVKCMPDERQWQSNLYNLIQDESFLQQRVDTFALLCDVIDHSLFAQVDWARNSPYFKDLQVDDQMLLLQSCWAELHLLDHTYHRLKGGLPSVIPLSNGQRFSLLEVALLGLSGQAVRLDDLSSRLTSLSFDKFDYAAMKFLTLLNPGLPRLLDRRLVTEGRERVKAAWMEYRQQLAAENHPPHQPSPFQMCTDSIRYLARQGEEMLYFKLMAGQVPGQTLLTEMLQTAARSRHSQDILLASAIKPDSSLPTAAFFGFS